MIVRISKMKVSLLGIFFITIIISVFADPKKGDDDGVSTIPTQRMKFHKSMFKKSLDQINSNANSKIVTDGIYRRPIAKYTQKRKNTGNQVYKKKSNVSAEKKFFASNANRKSWKQPDSTSRAKKVMKKKTRLNIRKHKLMTRLKNNNFKRPEAKVRVAKSLYEVINELKKIAERETRMLHKGNWANVKFVHPKQKSLNGQSKLSVGNLVISTTPMTQADSGAQRDSDKYNYKNVPRAIWKKEDACGGKCEQLCNDGLCACRDGYQLMKDNTTCLDINECAAKNGYCQHYCINLMGSYTCACNRGFQPGGKDSKVCDDINECFANNGHGICQGTCHNTVGSYHCSCVNRNGTRLSKNGTHCEDINECEEGSSGCSHDCINFYNGYVCNCPQGFNLGKDDKTCEDIDECQEEEIKEKCIVCKNIPGSYICPLKVDDLPRDQETIICQPLHPPEVGYFDCNRTNSVKPQLKEYPRELLINTVGAVCELICPDSESKMVFCGENGVWKTVEDQNISC